MRERQNQAGHIQQEARQTRLWLRLPIAISLLIFVAEVAIGFAANSLALLSDAGHVLTDLFALGFSWFAARQIARPTSSVMTFGYHRVGILAAAFNALTLVAVAGYIFYEAAQRLGQPPTVAGGPVTAMAIVGLAANLLVLWLLRRVDNRSLTLRSALWHVASDALGSVAVLVVGLVILVTGRGWVDPLASILIALLLLWGAGRLLRDSLRVFLEASPAHLDLPGVADAMTKVEGVRAVHDLHAWSLEPRLHALSAHVQVDDIPLSKGAEIIEELDRLLQERFGVHHTTLQLECAGVGDHPCTITVVLDQGSRPT